MKKALIIGGGLGGLASAVRLAKAGLDVTLLEKNHRVGGKAVEWSIGGYRWDMGPSLLTMPQEVDDLFEHAGKKRSDYLEFLRVDPTCRYFWRDGTTIDEDAAFFARPDVAAFLRYAEGIYELSGEAFLKRPPGDFWKAFSPTQFPKLKHLSKICTFSTVSGIVDRSFDDPHLRQLFKRFATYNGSDPSKAHASFNVIPYVEAEFGGWFVRGGMARLAEQIAALARELGVRILTGCSVERCDEHGALCSNGEIFKADITVVNGDVIRAHQEWLRFQGWHRLVKKLEKPQRSLSGLVVYLGVKHRYEHLAHHNIFFSDHYEMEFADLFEKSVFPSDPTLYLNISSRTQPDDAPEGCDNYFILANAPAETKKLSWDNGEAIAEKIIGNLEKRGLEGLSGHIEFARVFTPKDFADRDLSAHGALYGWASHSLKTALLRPPLRSPLNPNLYFVGGTTHPGGGIPLVLMGAKMTCDMILDSRF